MVWYGVRLDYNPCASGGQVFMLSSLQDLLNWNILILTDVPGSFFISFTTKLVGQVIVEIPLKWMSKQPFNKSLIFLEHLRPVLKPIYTICFCIYAKQTLRLHGMFSTSAFN